MDVTELIAFIVDPETESPPLDWIEVYVLLHNGALTDDSLLRIGEETKSIAEWRFWACGEEAGPFTWDQISRLQAQAGLTLEALAKIEGESEYSPLGEIVNRGGNFAEPTLTSRFVPDFLPASLSLFRSKSRQLTVLFVTLLVLSVILVFSSQRMVMQSHPPQETLPHIISVEDLPAKRLHSESSPENDKQADYLSTTAQLGNAITSEPEVPTSMKETILLQPEKKATPSKKDENPVVPQWQKTESRDKERESDSRPATFPVTVVARTPNLAAAKAPISPQISAPPPAKELGNIFAIASIKILRKPPKDGVGVWELAKDRKDSENDKFQPCLEVRVQTEENIHTENITAKAYFFDESNKQIASVLSPSPSGDPSKRKHHPMPVLLYAGKSERLFFQLPANLDKVNWKAVVVFGDRHEMQSACFPTTERDYLLSYPEKDVVYSRTARTQKRKQVIDPLIEHVVKTRNPKMPQITLFLRAPQGINDFSEVKGVLAISVLANSLDEMKRELRKEEMSGDYSGLFSFANRHKLAIIAWGARRLWDPTSNYDELPRDKAREIDQSLDIVTNAWEKGVRELGSKYGIPQTDFLLWGNCGSAQWAQRLCLRKPHFFKAVFIHMPGSYDKPTKEAANVLWCLTIGEREAGYERSIRWVKTVREMGYPIIYKGIPGLGHGAHPTATALGFEFYEFALSENNPENRDALLSKMRNPAFYGDMVNQEHYPANQVELIPMGYRIPLPSQRIKDIWATNRQ